MAEARTPQKSLPKINKVDQRFWDGARGQAFAAEMQELRQGAIFSARRLRRLFRRA